MILNTNSGENVMKEYNDHIKLPEWLKIDRIEMYSIEDDEGFVQGTFSKNCPEVEAYAIKAYSEECHDKLFILQLKNGEFYDCKFSDVMILRMQLDKHPYERLDYVSVFVNLQVRRKYDYKDNTNLRGVYEDYKIDSLSKSWRKIRYVKIDTNIKVTNLVGDVECWITEGTEKPLDLDQGRPILHKSVRVFTMFPNCTLWYRTYRENPTGRVLSF